MPPPMPTWPRSSRRWRTPTTPSTPPAPPAPPSPRPSGLWTPPRSIWTTSPPPRPNWKLPWLCPKQRQTKSMRSSWHWIQPARRF